MGDLSGQRAAFQEWVDGAEWAAPGEVTVVLAGRLRQRVPPRGGGRSGIGAVALTSTD
jgi:hypothetical protein